MTENLVPRVSTLCSPTQLYLAVRRAWATVCADSPCSRNAVMLLVSQWALETGFGHSCGSWNLGNYQHVPGDGHDYFSVLAWEIVNGQRVNREENFIAYASLDFGAAALLGHLRTRFKAAWPFVVAGDVAGFGHALKVECYYTAAESDYVSGMQRCYKQLDSSIPPDTLPELPPIRPELPDVVADEVTPDDELPEAT